jgi:hypothetical protein
MRAQAADAGWNTLEQPQTSSTSQATTTGVIAIRPLRILPVSVMAPTARRRAVVISSQVACCDAPSVPGSPCLLPYACS